MPAPVSGLRRHGHSSAGDGGLISIGGYGGTSTTSLAIGTGTKTFTTQAGLAYVAGSRIRAASDANPAADWMEGVCSSYSGTTLEIEIELTGGGGTHADWNLSIAGEAPAAWFGPWSAGTYTPGSAVEHDGSSYVANTTTTDEPPSGDWDLLAEKGADGVDGEDGVDGAGITEILDIATAEMDDTLVLAPDGAGGVEFRPESGGGGGSLTTVDAILGADVSMPSGGTWYDGPSASFAAGTWFISWKMLIVSGSSSIHSPCGRLVDNGATTEYDYSEMAQGSSGFRDELNGHAVVVLGATTTLKLQGRSDIGGNTMSRDGGNGSGHFASRLSAVKVA